MEIEVLLFGPVAEAAGATSIRLEMAPGSSVADARAALFRRWPGARGLLDSCACAVNERYVGDSSRLGSGDRLAVIPPVSGG